MLGDALIAAVAAGHVTDVAGTAKSWQETGEPFRPDPERHARYAKLIEASNELRTQLAPVFERLAQAVE